MSEGETQLFLDGAARKAAARALAEVAAPAVQSSREDLAREMVAACEAELTARPDPARTGRLHYEIARAFEGVLDDLERARQSYLAAREKLPEHLPTLRGARRTSIALGRHGDALPLFDVEARLTPEPHAKAMILYEKGVLLEDRLSQKREARKAYAAALELDAANPTILKAFERVSALSSEWADLDKAFEREANAVSSDARHRATVIAERARLADARQSAAERAIELYQTALAVDSGVPSVLAALKSLLYVNGRFRDLVAVLEQEARLAADPETRALALYRVGRVYFDRLGALDEAITALESAVAETPNDGMILSELARLYEVAKRWGKLASILETLAGSTPSVGHRVALLHRIGQIAEERLSDADRAVDFFRRALEADPAYLPALQALANLYTQRQHWTALIAMHTGEAESGRDVTRRAAAHGRIADILERHLDNVDQAIVHHTRALGLVPGYPPSFKALVRLYSQAKRFHELVELYERALDLAQSEDEKITLLFKIGRLHEDALHAPMPALAAFQRVLGINPNHLGAIHAIQRAAERGEAWDELVRALDLEADKVSAKAERAALLHRAAEVTEDLIGDKDAAIARYNKVLALDDRYAPALASLGRLYHRGGRWEDVLHVYQRELAVTPRGAPAAALLYKMGELAEDRLGRDDEAIKHYRAAVDADPKHLAALGALMRLESARGQWKDVVRLLELEMESLEDAPSRARTAFRIGETYENRLDDPKRALEAYDRALALCPDLRPALDGRTRLLERAKDHRALVDTLQREAAASKDPALTLVALLRAAEIYRDQLNDVPKAIESYEAVLEKDPNHLGALRGLEPLYAAQGAADKLGQCLTAQAQILENGLARVAVLRELARLEESRVAPVPAEIADRYQTIIRLAPTDTSALGALEWHALQTKDWALLMQVNGKLGALTDDASLASAYQTRLGEELEAAGDPSALDNYRSAVARDPENIAAARGVVRLAEQSGSPDLLAEAAAHAVRILRAPEKGATLLVSSAKRRATNRDVAGAVADLERALEACPDDERSVEALRELLLGSDPGKLADVLGHAAGRAKSPERRAELWVMVAGIHADQRHDTGAGRAALARALKEVPNHIPTLAKEAALFARDGQGDEAVKRLERIVQLAKAPDVLLSTHLELASLYDQRLSKPDKAAASLRAALAIDANHRRALAMLLDLEARRDHVDAALETATRLVEIAPEGPEQANAFVQLARLERKRGDVAEALTAFGNAVAIAGVEGGILEEMRSYIIEARRKGEPARWEAYANGLSRYLERARPETPRLSSIYVELARVLSDELRQVDKGLQALRVAASKYPADLAVCSEFATRLRAGGRNEEAADQLRRLVEMDPLRMEVWKDLAATLKAVGRAEPATVAKQVLVALGGGTDLERLDVQQRTARPAAFTHALDADVLRALDAAVSEDLPTTRLLSAASLGLERVYPPDFEAYGVSRGDRVSSRSGHPTRLLADRIARVVGAPEFELYVHQKPTSTAEIEFSDPVSIMVPVSVTKLPEGQQAFLLARVLIDYARGLHPIHKLAPSALTGLLTAAMRIVDPAFGGATQSEYLETLTKNLYKGLPRRGRKPLEDAAMLYGPSPKPRLDDWLLRARKTSTRAALLIADDPAGVVTVLRRTEGDLARLEPADLERGRAVLADVLRFALSDAATTVRKRLGPA